MLPSSDTPTNRDFQDGNLSLLPPNDSASGRVCQQRGRHLPLSVVDLACRLHHMLRHAKGERLPTSTRQGT